MSKNSISGSFCRLAPPTYILLVSLVPVTPTKLVSVVRPHQPCLYAAPPRPPTWSSTTLPSNLGLSTAPPTSLSLFTPSCLAPPTNLVSLHYTRQPELSPLLTPIWSLYITHANLASLHYACQPGLSTLHTPTWSLYITHANLVSQHYARQPGLSTLCTPTCISLF
jgi:hypothetical protein